MYKNMIRYLLYIYIFKYIKLGDTTFLSISVKNINSILGEVKPEM